MAFQQPMQRVFAELGIKHASTCFDSKCSLESCVHLKHLIRHAPTCKIKVARGCETCGEYWDIIQLHAKKCRSTNCVVLHCEDFRPERKNLVQVALASVSLPFTGLRRTFSKGKIIKAGGVESVQTQSRSFEEEEWYKREASYISLGNDDEDEQKADE